MRPSFFLAWCFAFLRFAAVGVVGAASFAADTTTINHVHIRNFGIVNEHILRGGEPTDVGLNELSSVGATLVIDLREAGSATALEKQEVEKRGMKYTNIPLLPLSAPSPAIVRSLLNLLAENSMKTVFVHCRRGKDRTGTIVACYRIQHDGWNTRQALDEANRFGMSPLEHGMRVFIAHFTPVTNMADPVLLTH